MEKYVSDLVNLEDIKISTAVNHIKSFISCNKIRVDSVTITHIPTGIIILESSDIGQLDAYNNCIKKIERMLEMME